MDKTSLEGLLRRLLPTSRCIAASQCLSTLHPPSGQNPSCIRPGDLRRGPIAEGEKSWRIYRRSPMFRRHQTSFNVSSKWFCRALVGRCLVDSERYPPWGDSTFFESEAFMLHYGQSFRRCNVLQHTVQTAVSLSKRNLNMAA